jgi:hypothetical protein
MTAADTIATGYTAVVGGVNMVASGVTASLVQLLVVLVGALLISAAVQGFKAEWRALFKKPLGGAAVRILVYGVSALFQMYNGYVHPALPRWEIAVLALLTALCATGIYHLAKRRQSASGPPAPAVADKV